MNNSTTIASKTVLLESISKMTGTSIEDIFLDTSVLALFKGNVHKLGVILYDFHELTGKSVDYSEEEITSEFKTIQHIVNYFELH